MPFYLSVQDIPISSHVKDHRYSHNIAPYFPDLTNFFVRTIFKTNLERAIVKLCSVKATKSDGENVVTQLNETRIEKTSVKVAARVGGVREQN